MSLHLAVVSVALCFLHGSCNSRFEADQRAGRTGCIRQHVYETMPRGPDGWIEVLPSQKTSYDRYGNAILKVHYWPSGCWMVIERCNLQGNSCRPGSCQKFRFLGCSFTNGTCALPSNQGHWTGAWVSHPKGCPAGPRDDGDNYARPAADHAYARYAVLLLAAI